MDYGWIVVAILYFALSHGVALMGERWGIGYGKALFWSILYSPLLGFIIALFSRPHPEKKPA